MGKPSGLLSLFPASLVFFLFSCCATPPPVPDFSTPVAVLTTFQQAFRAGEPRLEYECFSQELKEKKGGLDYDGYVIGRRQALEENPLLGPLLDLKDLPGHVTSLAVDPGGRRAEMTLDILGKRIGISFVRETVYRLEFDGDRRVREGAMSPLAEAIAAKKGAFSVAVENVPPSWLEKFPSLRKLVLEELWKFGDFGLITCERAAPPPRP